MERYNEMVMDMLAWLEPVGHATTSALKYLANLSEMHPDLTGAYMLTCATCFVFLMFIFTRRVIKALNTNPVVETGHRLKQGASSDIAWVLATTRGSEDIAHKAKAFDTISELWRTYITGHDLIRVGRDAR